MRSRIIPRKSELAWKFVFFKLLLFGRGVFCYLFALSDSGRYNLSRMKREPKGTSQEDNAIARQIEEINTFDESAYQLLLKGRVGGDVDDRERIVKVLCLYARSGDPVDFRRVVRDFHVPEVEIRSLMSSYRNRISEEEERRNETLLKLLDKSALVKGITSENPQMIQFVRHEILGQKGQADAGMIVQIGTLNIQVNKALRGRVREEARELFEKPLECLETMIESTDCSDDEFIRNKALSTEMLLGNVLESGEGKVLKVTTPEKRTIE